jgi:hypothetical protein
MEINFYFGLRRLILVYYRGLFDIKGETRGHQTSGTFMLSWILVTVREFRMYPTKDVVYVWAALQLQFKKSF